MKRRAERVTTIERKTQKTATDVPDLFHIFGVKLPGAVRTTSMKVLGSPDDPMFIAEEISRFCNVSIGAMAHRLSLWKDRKLAFKLNVKNPTATGRQRKTQMKWVLTESGVVKFALTSQNKYAKNFANWLIREVIPLARRAKAGDHSLLKYILDRSDELNSTTTLTTCTTFPRAHDNSDVTISQHTVLAQQHAHEFLHSSKDQDKRMLSSFVDERGVVSSQWTSAIIALDELWADLEENFPEEDPRSVYFIRMLDTDLVKVGFSKNVHTRLASLQIGCGIELTIEFSFLTEKYRSNEQALHKYLKQSNVRGEWHRIPKDVDYFAILTSAGVQK